MTLSRLIASFTAGLGHALRPAGYCGLVLLLLASCYRVVVVRVEPGDVIQQGFFVPLVPEGRWSPTPRRDNHLARVYWPGDDGWAWPLVDSEAVRWLPAADTLDGGAE
jgi:hypothetical protein